MPLYEHVFLARQDVTPQQVEGFVDQFKAVIEQNGGRVEKTEMWGVKSLAYRIKKNRKAHFTMFNLDAPAPAVAEMERQMRINEDILRFMTIRVDALDAEPSVMMQKRERDERKDRERRRRAPSVLPPAQDLPLLGAQCAEDRLQGHQAPVALRVGARQDRAEPHHGGLGQEAARAGPGHQACPHPRAPALRDSVILCLSPGGG